MSTRKQTSLKKSASLNTNKLEKEEKDLDFSSWSPLRRNLRQLLLPFVQAGTNQVVQIQKSRSPTKTKIMQLASVSGNHNFYVLFFPILFFCFGSVDLARHLLILLALGIYIGNFFKDLLCLPRPPPPVERMTKHGSLEFGFPSTHSVSGVQIPFLMLIYSGIQLDSKEFFFLLTLSICWMTLVSYSRMYLGMHSIADLIGGIVIGFMLLVFWYGFGLGDLLDEWIFNGSYVEFITIGVGIILLVIHPEPISYCACFDDSACFIGSAVGVLCGTTRYQSRDYVINHSLLLYLVRWSIAISIILLVRLAMKRFTYIILPYIYDIIRPPVRKFLPHLSSKTKIDHHNMKKVPTISLLSDENDDSNIIYPRWDVDIASKYIVYLTMGWICSEMIPQFLRYLQLV